MDFKLSTERPSWLPEETAWDKLPMNDKRDIMRVCLRNGISSLEHIKLAYNNYRDGRNIFDGMPDYKQEAAEFGNFLAMGGPEDNDPATKDWEHRRKHAEVKPQYKRTQRDEEYWKEKNARNARAAEELNRRKDTVMSALSNIADSVPFTGSAVKEAVDTQRQEKLNKWHEAQKMVDATMTAAELAAAGYGVIRGLTHFNRMLARQATQSTGQAIGRNALQNLLKWNQRVANVDRPQVLMNGIGGTADAYQWLNADNSFDAWENGLETGANAAGVVGGMNWFRNLPVYRRFGNVVDATLDGLGYGAAAWDAVKNLPPLSTALEGIRQQSINGNEKGYGGFNHTGPLVERALNAYGEGGNTSDYRYVQTDDGQWNRVSNDDAGRIFQGFTATPSKATLKHVPQRIDNSQETAARRDRFLDGRDANGHLTGEPGLGLLHPEFDVMMGARMAMPTYSQQAVKNYQVGRAMKLESKRMPDVNKAFRYEEWGNFLNSRNGDNYYRMTNITDEARKGYSAGEDYFVSHTTPWEEFSGMRRIEDPLMIDKNLPSYHNRLYEFPTKTFGTRKSSSNTGILGDVDVSLMGKNHLYYGDTSSSVRGPVRVISDKQADYLGISPYRMDIADRPLTPNGLFDKTPVYEDIHMGNQTVINGAELQDAIQNSAYNVFEHTPYFFMDKKAVPPGITRILHLEK